MSNKRITLIIFLSIASIYFTLLISFPSTRIRATHIIFVFASFIILYLLFLDSLQKITKPLNSFLSKYTPAWKLFASTYTGVATVILLFFNPTIVENSKNGFLYLGFLLEINSDFDPTKYKFDFWVSLYWFFLLVWLIDYVVFVTIEAKTNQNNSAQNRERLDEIRSAIAGAPNPEVFPEYYLNYDNIYDWFQWLYYVSEKEGHLIDNYNRAFRIVLGHVANITAAFARSNSGIYGANLMIYVPNDSKFEVLIAKIKADTDSWIHYKKTELKFIQGVLHGVPNLKVEDHRLTEDNIIDIKNLKKDGRKVKSVNLAIPDPDSGHRVIPGACTAATHPEKKEYVMNNVLNIDEYFSDFDKKQREEALTFFKGQGQSIKSFFSIRIPASGVPLDSLKSERKLSFTGTLNVDCSETYLLGQYEKYYSAYFSLIGPISTLFAPFMERYLHLLLDDAKQKN